VSNEQAFGLPPAENNSENIAATLARVLPQPGRLAELPAAGGGQEIHLAIPKGFTVHKVDDEKLLANPRRKQGAPAFSDAESFLAFVDRNATADTIVWCQFNPQDFKLSFRAVFDEHGTAASLPGWRGFGAVYEPALSHEWKLWKAQNKQAKSQFDFAVFLEENIDDIAERDGYPTGQQMYAMATAMELNKDSRVKSTIRTQSGGQAFEFVDNEKPDDIVKMEAYKAFRIGIPVFWAGAGYVITARLRYRNNGGALSFWYELNRPDRVYDDAAKDLITKVREGIGGLPLIMGSWA
jgi:uncharacterized protein YfdQ (DUF2303 family)